MNSTLGSVVPLAMLFLNLLGDVEGGEVPLLVLAHQEGKLAERFGIVPAILSMMTVVFTGLAIGLILKAHHFCPRSTTWREAELSCRCLYSGLWLSHQVPGKD